MCARLLAVGLTILLVGACNVSAPNADVTAAPSAPTVPGPVASSAERPWKAHVEWSVTAVQWAGVPGVEKSLFDGRCSVLSDYIVRATFAGEATHAGRITGETEHCTQITWSADGQPIAVTYDDGRGNIVAADGSRLVLTWTNGTTGFDAATGETWFRDEFTLIGETGRFAGATGGGEEGGRFLDFAAVLAGTPVPMWMSGTITYDPGKRTPTP